MQRRGGRYFWRARVPADLIPILGRQEIVKTLDTADPRAARERVARYHAHVMAAWMEARAMSTDGATADQVQAWLEGLLATLDAAQTDARNAHGTRPTMLQTIAAYERDEVAEAAHAAIPSLVAAIAAAEADRCPQNKAAGGL